MPSAPVKQVARWNAGRDEGPVVGPAVRGRVLERLADRLVVGLEGVLDLSQAVRDESGRLHEARLIAVVGAEHVVRRHP
jgi:hypothetical protein